MSAASTFAQLSDISFDASIRLLWSSSFVLRSLCLYLASNQLGVNVVHKLKTLGLEYRAGHREELDPEVSK